MLFASSYFIKLYFALQKENHHIYHKTICYNEITLFIFTLFIFYFIFFGVVVYPGNLSIHFIYMYNQIVFFFKTRFVSFWSWNDSFVWRFFFGGGAELWYIFLKILTGNPLTYSPKLSLPCIHVKRCYK